MTIQTRYRDIPFNEAAKCAPLLANTDPHFWESKRRGQPVTINVPGFARANGRFFECSGPFYDVASPPVMHKGVLIQHTVCPHIAEIGD